MDCLEVVVEVPLLHVFDGPGGSEPGAGEDEVELQVRGVGCGHGGLVIVADAQGHEGDDGVLVLVRVVGGLRRQAVHRQVGVAAGREENGGGGEIAPLAAEGGEGHVVRDAPCDAARPIGHDLEYGGYFVLAVVDLNNELRQVAGACAALVHDVQQR
jgi:hypothetical protein